MNSRSLLVPMLRPLSGRLMCYFFDFVHSPIHFPTLSRDPSTMILSSCCALYIAMMVASTMEVAMAATNAFGHIEPQFDHSTHVYITPKYERQHGLYVPIVPKASASAASEQAWFPTSTSTSSSNKAAASGRAASDFRALSTALSPTFVGGLWPDAVMVYEFAQDINPEVKYWFMQAMKDVASRTSIRFRERESSAPAGGSFAVFRSNVGCKADIGRFAGASSIGCDHSCAGSGSAKHELLHALGLGHTHNDRYRDAFVSIQWNNLIESAKKDFNTKTQNTFEDDGADETEYDYSSIMHYPGIAFSSNGKYTIVARDPQFQEVIGQREDMSPGDVIALEKIYSMRAKYRYRHENTLLDELVQVVAVYTNVHGEERTVPERGYVWVKPREISNFILATNSATIFVHVRTANGRVINQSKNIAKCRPHSPWGMLCFERKQLQP